MICTKRFEEALAFACQVHSGQLRKGSQIPYIAHLLGVTGIALEYGADEDEAIGALLHDAVEDQGGRPMLEQIRFKFGDSVARIVDECTDSYVFPKPPWRERKETYLAHLPKASTSSRLVSAADKLYNVRTIVRDYRNLGEKVWDRFHAGKEDILWYYGSLIRTFRKTSTQKMLVDELQRIYTELVSLSRDGLG